jgi:hypothetical protein
MHQSWFIFGTSAYPHLNLVDLNDGNDDVIINLKQEVAQEIIALRQKYLNDLYKIIEKNWNPNDAD